MSHYGTNTAAELHGIRGRSVHFMAAAFLLVTAMLLGGGGSRFAISEMLVQLAAIPALFFGLGNMRSAPDWPAFRFPVLLLGAAALLVLLQLIPLPPFIWQSLPGRELWAEAANLLPGGASWLSWSVDPELTLQSGLSLVVPAAMIVSVLHMNAEERKLMLYIALAMVGINFGVAMLQTLSGGESFYPYNTTHKGYPLGLFANRNHTAQLMLMSIFMAAGLMAAYSAERISGGERTGRNLIMGAIILVLTFAILATNSRTVTALLLPAFIFLAFQFIPARLQKRSVWIICALLAAMAGLFAMLLASGRFQVVNILADRYSQDDDYRFDFWPDAWYTMWEYMPMGSGLGTFDTVFRANEKLSTVGSHYVNNAHNDYLEVAIETGIFGLAIMLALLIWICKTILRLIENAQSRDVKLAIYAAAALAGIALHSLIDYPLRSLSITAFAALLLGVLAASRTRGSTRQKIPNPKPRRV